MKIQTKFFGEIDIDEKNIINFKNGIPGFEEYKKFILLDIEDNDSLKCLQSLDEISVCLMTIAPWSYFKDYEIELSEEDTRELGIEKEHDAAIYNVIAARNEKITANLVAPIVINIMNNKGKQIVLSNTKYSIRQEIACL